MRPYSRWAVLLTLLLAGWQFGAAATVHAKAWLGQALLERTWRAGLATQTPLQPWPWADMAPVARIRLPEVGIERLVLDGFDGGTLAWGPGMVQGRGGHRIIAGHRDTHFRFLEQLRPGDRLELEGIEGIRERWHVAEAAIVDARHSALDMTLDEERLTLVTCYPFDAVAANGPLRYVVSLLREGDTSAVDRR